MGEADVDLELTRLELRFALSPWHWAKALDEKDEHDSLLELGIRDLQGLRREANRMLLPDAAQRRKAADGDLCFIGPVPCDEQALLALTERILNIEALRSLVADSVPGRAARHTLWELLRNDIGSPQDLQNFNFDALLGLPLSEQVLAALLGEAKAGNERRSDGCQLSRFGPEPFLATAPHNAYLRRDGHPPHLLEEHTTFIAERLAHELRGCALCWSRLVQWRSETDWALGRRRKAAGGGAEALVEALDAQHRDPNHLSPGELDENPWYRTVSNWAKEQQVLMPGCGVCAWALHVDVHGCQDPPRHAAHAILGLGGMRRYSEAFSAASPEGQRARQQMLAMAAQLQDAVVEALSPIPGLEGHPLAVVTGVDPNAAATETLPGAWPVGSGRLTQTQQSICYAGVSHAVQLELGRGLRLALRRDPEAIVRLAHAIYNAWQAAMKAKGAVNDIAAC